MSPDDIPTEITKLVCTDQTNPGRSQNMAAEMLAHYWPAIEQHIRAQVLADTAAGFRRTPRDHRDYAGSVRAARLIEELLARTAAPTGPADRPCGCSARFEGHAWGCPTMPFPPNGGHTESCAYVGGIGPNCTCS